MPNGIIKSYVPTGSTFTEDAVNGWLKGIEWSKNNGNTFRVLFTHENLQLNLINKTIDFAYIKEMREEGDVDWFAKNYYHFDGSEWINNLVGGGKYGKHVVNPYQPDGVTLKPNTVPFIEYYIDSVILGKYPPIPLYQTLLDIAANKEGVTLP